MKTLVKTLSFLGLSLSLSMYAQTGSGKEKQQAAPNNEAKAAYISNQSYLSSGSSHAYTDYYGDSLKGFDEAKTTKEVLAIGLPGLEAQIYLHHLKRRFINRKYNIGPNYQYMPVPTGPPSGAGKSAKLGSATVNFAPCVNEDFELTPPGVYSTSNAVTGWTISSRVNDGSCNPTNWAPGSSEFAIVQTPILNWGSVGGAMGIIPGSPLGGNNVAQLNNHINNANVTRICQQFPVTNANSLLQVAYAGYWQDGGVGHNCCPVGAGQPGLNIKMYDCNGAPLSCHSLSLSSGPGCQSQGVTYTVTPGIASWSGWQVRVFDLTPYIGSCVTIEIITADCMFGCHWGSTLIDTRCGGPFGAFIFCNFGVNVGGRLTSYCTGSNIAQIGAPNGYIAYQWFAPNGSPIPAPQGTAQVLTILNPTAGTIYTVQMTQASGCVFTVTNQITPTSVSILGLGSSSTCAGGAGGSATVVGTGSGTGYNYTWINALTSATVGTTSVVSNLSAGVYSVILSGYGAAGCGTAVATTTVTTGMPGVTRLLKPFCSTEAYFSVTGGSNFQWYHNSVPIPAPFGTSPSFTLSPATAGHTITIACNNIFGCKDSIEYILVASTPGKINLNTISRVCPNGVNGTAQVSLTPAPNSAGGFNSFLVTSTGNTPAYTASLYPTSSNVFNLGGMAGGTYSVSVSDGSCRYNTTFSVVPFAFSYSLSTSSATLCPGNSVASAISFSDPAMYGQFTYSWTPKTNLFGATTSNAIITPSLPPVQQATMVYSVIVTPTLINCPVVKTVSVTAVNPPTPTIMAIPSLCNTFAPYQILTTPPGGTFYTDITGPKNPVTSQGGVITPSLAANGLNSFTYAISVYTCVAKNTATYEVSRFWTSALSSSVPPLCVTSPGFNLNSIVQNTQNGVWTGPQVTNVGGSYYFNPSNLNTGSYTITYLTISTPDPTVCPSTTTLNVAVTNTSVPVITPVPEFCTNAAPITINSNPAGGEWLPVANGAISKQGVISPPLMPVPGLMATYTVSDGPCVNSNTVQLHVTKYYSADLTGTATALCFNSKPVNLMSIVQNTINGSWSSGGPGLSGTFFTSAGLPTGTYTATYNTTSSPNATLCPDARTIYFSVLNPVMPSITPVPAMCNNAAPVQLSVSPGDGYWTASPYLSPEGIFTPSLSSVGDNPVQYVAGTSTCNLKDTRSINIEAFIPATITSKLPDLCNTSPVINLAPLTISNKGIWSGAGVSGTSFDPAITGTGEFVLTYSTASLPNRLCSDQKTMVVNVREKLSVEIFAEPEGACVPVVVNFYIQNRNSGSGIWTIGDGSTVKGLEGSHVFTTPGTYTIQLDYSDLGCKALPVISREIRVNDPPEADFSMPEEIYITEPSLQINNLSAVPENNKYEWEVSGLSAQYHEIHPVIKLPGIGKYQVTLNVTSVQGCKNKITKTVVVKNNFDVFIPNSFSPNFDGLNDVFLPVYGKEGLDLKNYEMEIFDRWGHLLFRSKDSSKGWDGLSKGEPLKQDTYVYKIRYRDAEGNNCEKIGNVSLVK